MTKHKYFNEIDSLRAIAVVAVILNHIEKSWLPGGFLGVDVFFVVSGFVVTASLLGQSPSSFRIFIGGFYAKRIKRLYPALLVCLAFSLAAAFMLFPDPSGIAKTAKLSILGLGNIQLYKEAQNYFSTNAAANPFTHMWSLGVEEQFYFVFPVLFYLLRKDLKKFIFANLLLVCASFVAFVLLKTRDEMFAFYMMPARYWQLGIGALVATSSATNVLRRSSPHLVLLPLAGIFACLIFTPEFSLVPTILVSLCTGLALCLIKETPERPYLLWKPALASGRFSYSLYLYHWPLIVFARETVSLDQLIPLLTLMVLFSVGSYYFVENRFRQRTWRRIDKFVFGTILAVVVVGSLKPKLSSQALFLGTVPAEYSVWGQVDRRLKQDCVISGNAKFPFKSATQLLEHYTARCRLLGSGAQARIITFGNSYLEEKLPALMTLAQNREADLFTIIAPGSYLYPYEAISKRHEKERSKFLWQTFLDSASQFLRSGDLVVLSTPLQDFLTSELRFTNQSKALVSGEEGFQIFVRELNLVRDQLAARGVTLMMIGAYPILRADVTPAHCIQPWSKFNRKCSAEEIFDVEQSQKIRSLDNVLAEKLGTNYVRIFDKIQTASENSPAQLYFNPTHLSVAGSAVIESALGL